MKKVFITGATSLLGQALVAAFAAQGQYRFILHGRNETKLRQMQRHYGEQIEGVIVADLLACSSEILDAFFEQHYHWSLPDIVIHAVGGAVSGDGHPLSVSVVEQAMRINCALSISVSEALISQWQQVDHDQPLTIVHISSAATKLGNAAPAYVMAKAALEAWTKNLAGFYTDSRLSIFAVQPGPLLSGHWQQAEQQQTEAYLKKLQLRQDRPFPKVEETAEQIVSMVLHQPQLFHGQVVNMSGSLLT